MCLKKIPGWLKGGIIGVGIFLILFILIIIGTTFFSECRSSRDDLGMPLVSCSSIPERIIYPVFNVITFPVRIIIETSPMSILFLIESMIIFLIIGAIIGWVVGKIKSKNKKISKKK